jgi:hypothetical protein
MYCKFSKIILTVVIGALMIVSPINAGKDRTTVEEFQKTGKGFRLKIREHETPQLLNALGEVRRTYPQEIIDLTYARLTGLNLQGITLENINFDGAKLEGTSLRESTIKNCTFREADLINVSLVKARLENVNFDKAFIGVERDGKKQFRVFCEFAQLKSVRFSAPHVADAFIMQADTAEDISISYCPGQSFNVRDYAYSVSTLNNK